MAPPTFDTASPTVADAQRDMRQAYCGGAPGIFASGLVWIVAAFVCFRQSPEHAIWALFVGGMFIHPIAILLNKMIGRSGKHTAGNPMGALAMESTIWMILGFALAYGVSLVRIEFFFPAMLFIIGGRYLTFSTIYGARIYWVVGAALALAGWWLAKVNAAPVMSALAGGLIEVAFAAVVFFTSRRERGGAPVVQSA